MPGKEELIRDDDSWKEELKLLIKAKFPLIYVRTHDEQKVDQFIYNLWKVGTVYLWSAVSGIQEYSEPRPNSSEPIPNSARMPPPTTDPKTAILRVLESTGMVCYVFHDLHNFFDDPYVVRALREVVDYTKAEPEAVILVSPVVVIPPDLEKDIVVVDTGYPGPSEHMTVLLRIVHSIRALGKAEAIWVDLTDAEKNEVVGILDGLTAYQGECLVAKSIMAKKAIDIDYIRSERAKLG